MALKYPWMKTNIPSASESGESYVKSFLPTLREEFRKLEWLQWAIEQSPESNKRQDDIDLIVTEIHRCRNVLGKLAIELDMDPYPVQQMRSPFPEPLYTFKNSRFGKILEAVLKGRTPTTSKAIHALFLEQKSAVNADAGPTSSQSMGGAASLSSEFHYQTPSPFVFFANEELARLRVEQPNLKFGEVCKLLDERWTDLSNAQRGQYYQMEKDERMRYGPTTPNRGENEPTTEYTQSVMNRIEGDPPTENEFHDIQVPSGIVILGNTFSALSNVTTTDQTVLGGPNHHRFESLPVTNVEQPPRSHAGNFSYNDYTIALISALPIERACTEGMLDEHHQDLPQPFRDSNAYTYGRIGKHNVVLASLAGGVIGNVSAATVATRVWTSFPKLRFGLMVGVGGGAPDMEHAAEHDIRLGDVVVSKPEGRSGGVVQYTRGTALQGYAFGMLGFLNRPPDALLAALLKLESKHLMVDSDAPRYLSEMLEKYPRMRVKCSYQGAENDELFEAAYEHHNKDAKTCAECDTSRLVPRPERLGGPAAPAIHYGTILSGDIVMRDALTRDIQAKEYNALCFEMEAAGLRGDFPCLIIRGICDYCDSHKNKRWQPYAAATAAAYAKELLYTVSVEQT